MNDEILKITNCTYVNYNKIDKKFYRLLDDINLSIRKSEIHFVIGESGSSKSSLVDVISGIKDCYPGLINGDILFNHHKEDSNILLTSKLDGSGIYEYDKCLDQLLINKKKYAKLQRFNSNSIRSVYENKFLSVIHQQNKEFLYPKLTMLEFINKLNLTLDEKNRFYDLLENHEVFNKDDLEEFHKKTPKGFSGGQKMRINIALAFCLNSDLLIADEPTTGIDDELKDTFIDDFWSKVLSESNKSYLIVTHDFDFLYNILKRNRESNNKIFIHTMFGGKLIQSLDFANENPDELHPYVHDLFKLSYNIKSDNRDIYIGLREQLLKSFIPHDNSIDSDLCSYFDRCGVQGKSRNYCHYDVIKDLDVKCQKKVRYDNLKELIEDFNTIDYNKSSSINSYEDIIVKVYKDYKKEFLDPDTGETGYTLKAERDLLMYKNHFNFIIGRSGSGKSTLLKSISGLLNINNNIIEINNSIFSVDKSYSFTDINDVTKNRELLSSLQYVFQESSIAFNKKLNCYEIIKEAYDNLYPKVNKKLVKELSIELLNKIGINDNKLYQEGSNLSGGEIKRLLLARSFASLGYGLNQDCYSKVLLIDELTTGYDILNQELIIDFIKSQIKTMNLTFIIASHNMNLIHRCDEKIVYQIEQSKDGSIGIIK